MARQSSVSLMTEGNVKKLILTYAGPIFIGQLFQQLYNTADAMIVGNYVGQNAYEVKAKLELSGIVVNIEEKEVVDVYNKYKRLLSNPANMFMSFTVFKDVSFSSLDSFKESLINVKKK